MDPTESIGDSAEGEVTQADEQEMMVRMMQMLSAQLGKTEESSGLLGSDLSRLEPYQILQLLEKSMDKLEGLMEDEATVKMLAQSIDQWAPLLLKESPAAEAAEQDNDDGDR